MFGAFWRLIKTIGYLLTGNINAVSNTWQKKSAVISATYDDIVKQKQASLQQYQSAVGAMIGEEERKKEILQNISLKVRELEGLKSGALNKAKKILESFGGDVEKCKANPEYIKCQADHRDFSSTLKEKNDHAAELEADIRRISASVSTHKTKIHTLIRELQKIKEEKHETIAEVIAQEEEKKTNDMFNGISEDKTAEALARMRDMRTKTKGEARISRELSGQEFEKTTQEYLEYAKNTEADSEFEALLGIAEKEQSSAPVAEEATPSVIEG